jgi:hypothetical protein
MSNGNNEGPSKFQIWWKPMSIGTLIAVVPVIIAVNQSYVQWHDVRYPRRTEVLLLAEAQTMQKKADHAHDMAEANSAKLDFLVLKAARDEIRQLRRDIQAHKENNDNSVLWRKQLIQLENDLEGSINYFNCLEAKRPNCESVR